MSYLDKRKGTFSFYPKQVKRPKDADCALSVKDKTPNRERGDGSGGLKRYFATKNVNLVDVLK